MRQLFASSFHSLKSYCAQGRGYETQREINEICMDMGHDRNGKYAHLFDPALPLFYDREADDAPPEVKQFMERQRERQRQNRARQEAAKAAKKA